MSLTLATKGIIRRGGTGTGPGETVYILEMNVDVEKEALDVAVQVDDFSVTIDIEEDGWA